ncbi:acetyltransferase [Devosia sp. Root436]|nr:acetyltransferase [Devosia sp. Root436]
MLDSRVHNTFAGAPSFTLRHRVVRALFGVVWFILARWTPPPMHRWRVFLLNLFGARVSPTARVYGSARIWYPKNLSMAAQSVLGPGVICYCMAKISIGERAIVSQRAHLCAGSHHVDDEHFQLFAEPISIGSNAWVAAEAFVGPGVTIGQGAVLGARGVAAKNLSDWTIYVGNPARPLRERKRF